MLETAIYVRVSTEEQAQEGFSIRAQEQKLRDYTRLKDWLVYKVYMDEGISGKNITDRPAINEMIEDIKKGHVKNVLVFKIDRLTRSTSDLISLVELFNKHDCAFNSLTESIDTQSATGRMFIRIIGTFAEFERKNISERARLGCERKVKEGYSLCTNTVSYGYDRKKGEKIQTINEAEAKIVKEIFHMFTDRRMSYHYIAKNLNSRNIPTKGKSIWWGRTIADTLTNCNYKGYVRYSTDDKKRYFETKGLHEPIISEELYNETQDLINKMSVKVYKKHPKESNYFAGIIFCSICGEKMLVRGLYKKDKNGEQISHCHYFCPNRNKGDCTAIGVSQPKIEQAFIQYINNVEDFSELDEIQLAMKKEIKDQNLELIKDLKRQYDKLERRGKELVNSYIQGNIDIENYKLIKTGIDEEKKTVSGTIETIEAFVDEEITIKRENIIKDLKENWERLNNAEKRQFLINFIEKIEVINEKENGKREGSTRILNVEFNKN